MSFIGEEDNCSRSPSQSQKSESEIYYKAEAVVEYEWPADSGQEYFIEEYLADYLEIKYMRRAYPTVERRRIQTLDEREYLLEMEFVTELQCDLGVYVIPSEQVYEVIAPDFKKKFQVYEDLKSQKSYEKFVNVSWKHYLPSSEDGSESLQSLTSEQLKIIAVKDCAFWNSKHQKNANKKCKPVGLNCNHEIETVNDKARTKPGLFPVAVLPGQYVDVTPRFSSEEILCLPLNTVLQLPPAIDTKNDPSSSKARNLERSVENSTIQDRSNIDDNDKFSQSGSSTYVMELNSSSCSSSTMSCQSPNFYSDFECSRDSLS